MNATEFGDTPPRDRKCHSGHFSHAQIGSAHNLFVCACIQTGHVDFYSRLILVFARCISARILTIAPLRCSYTLCGL